MSQTDEILHEYKESIQSLEDLEREQAELEAKKEIDAQLNVKIREAQTHKQRLMYELYDKLKLVREQFVTISNFDLHIDQKKSEFLEQINFDK